VEAFLKKSYLYIALATLLFSSMEIALKSISGAFNPIQLNFIRFFVGALLLLPFGLKSMKLRGARFSARDIGFYALTGFIGIALSMTLYQIALTQTKASIVAVVFSCNPVFVLPFAALILKEKIKPYAIVTMVLSLGGMFVIMNLFQGAAGVSLPGIILTILSAVAFALYGVLGKLKTQSHGGLAATAFSFLFASGEMLLFIALSHAAPVARGLEVVGLGRFAAIPLLRGISLATLPTLAYVSLCVTGLGYAFYFLAIETSSATTAAIVFYIKPALAPLLALLLIRESIAPTTLVGIVLIVLGSAITFWGNSRKTS
jgi:drug/metabolite transporter (DMT)-like permease